MTAPLCTVGTQQKAGPSAPCLPSHLSCPHSSQLSGVAGSINAASCFRSHSSHLLERSPHCARRVLSFFRSTSERPVLREALVDSLSKIFTTPMSSTALTLILVTYSSPCSLFVSCFLNCTLKRKGHIFLTCRYIPGAYHIVVSP